MSRWYASFYRRDNLSLTVTEIGTHQYYIKSIGIDFISQFEIM